MPKTNSDTAKVAANIGDICPPDSALDLTKTESAPIPPKTPPPDTVAGKKAPVKPDTASSAPTAKRETAATRDAETKPQEPAKPKTLPRLWDFGSDKCIPCMQMEPILNALKREYSDKIDVRIINVYQDPMLANQFRIQVIPTQVFIDTSGKEVYRHVGFYSRDSILAKFAQFGWK